MEIHDDPSVLRNAFCLNLIIATTLKRLSAVAFVIIGIVKVFFGEIMVPVLDLANRLGGP